MLYTFDYVYLNFEKKIVYFGKCSSIYDEPATDEEYTAFVEYFLKYGQKVCTFTELRKYVYFHGVRKKGRVYSKINIVNKYDFLTLKRIHPNTNRAIKIAIDNYNIKQEPQTPNKKDIENISKKILSKTLRYIANEIENTTKQ